MTSTMRLFVNDNRISTAVKVKTGGLLQVYPVKKKFASEVEWQQHWDLALKPKIILRFSDKEDEAEKKPVAPVPVKASLDNWLVDERNGFVLSIPAGSYYIGDLCYVLGDDVYDNIFGGTGYEPGIYIEKGSSDYVGQSVGKNRFFAVARTAYGDGMYPASDGKEFAVDAGILGICSTSLMAKNDGGGYVYTFDKPVVCRFEDGRFAFNWGYESLVIDTTGDDEEY